MWNKAAILFSVLALTACDDGTDPADSPDGGGGAGGGGFPLAGSWVDTFGTTHTITEDAWVQTFMGADSTFAFVDINTEQRQILAQNDAANMFNPGLYSRFDWVVDGEDVFVCQAAFDKATAQDAAAVAPSDDSDPLNGGCGGMFPWTQLLPEE